MSKTMMGLALVFSLVAPMSGCNIENCEQGADCTEDGDDLGPPDRGESQQCLGYCNRLNVCGAPQAEDFDGCVAACEVRFEKLPKETAALCACIVESRCEDAIEGHCTPPGDGAGGSHASGGGAGTGGSSSTTGGASSTGGSSSATGGSSNGSGGGGGSTGGASGTGGAPSSGGSSSSEGGAACGGEPSGSAGDSSSAGTGAGTGGEDPAVACTCDCDCLAEQACVDGYCSG